MNSWYQLLLSAHYILGFLPPLLFGLWLHRIWRNTREPAYLWLAIGIGWIPLLIFLWGYAAANLVGPGRLFDVEYNAEGYRQLQLWVPQILKFLRHAAILLAIAGFYDFKVDCHSLIKPLRGMKVEG